ncbi:MAG: HAD family hydrolase [Acidobacteria bacterium]|nr:MAG: HAD family hydrolase [Acidobacteriota bacterium]
MITAIVFDFDGVLADSEPLHLRSYQDVLGPAGITLGRDEYYARYLGFDDEGAFRQIVADKGLMLADEELELLLAEKARRFEALVLKADVLYPGAAACLDRLAAYPLGIASGALRHEIELPLRAAHLLDRFRFIVSAEDAERTKPDPEPYLRAAALHEAPPSACVAIEDSHWGLQSARGAGLRTIAITHTYPREALTDADAIVESLDELTETLIAGL